MVMFYFQGSALSVFYSTLSSDYTMTLRDSSYEKVRFYRSCLNAYLGQLVHCSGFILRKRAGYMLYNMSIEGVSKLIHPLFYSPFTLSTT